MANKVKIPRTPAAAAPAAPAPIKDSIVAGTEEDAMVTVKRVFCSKTIWVNLLAFLAFWIQREYGFVISEDLQMQALTLVNIALRFVTKEAIAWGGSSSNGTNKETT